MATHHGKEGVVTVGGIRMTVRCMYEYQAGTP